MWRLKVRLALWDSIPNPHRMHLNGGGGAMAVLMAVPICLDALVDGWQVIWFALRARFLPSSVESAGTAAVTVKQRID